MSLGAVILAAGYSSRMGAFKPLLTIGSKSLIGHCVNLFQECGVGDILVVLGHAADKAIPEVERYHCHYIKNKRYKEGMFSSMQVGIAALKGDCNAFFILPVDIPLVRKETVEKLLSVFQEDSTNSVYYPQYQGRKGHPPLIHGRLINSILSYTGENGLRGLLRMYENQSVVVPVDDPFILNDVDTEGSFLKLQRKFQDKTELRV